MLRVTILVWHPMEDDMFVLRTKVDGDQGQCPRLLPNPVEALIL